MIDAVQVLWSPVGISLPPPDAHPFMDRTEEHAPTVSMPIRLVSVDTPEVTAGGPEGARVMDQMFLQLADWMHHGQAPISAQLAEHLFPKIATGKAGTLHFEQGKAASAFADANVRRRLARPGRPDRRLFIRSTEPYLDERGRLLAYLAPGYSAEERAAMSREQRSTFNLDLVTAGWAAPFVVYPALPGALDLQLLLTAAERSMRDATTGNIWSNPHTLLGYEYRMLEKLHAVTKRIVRDQDVAPADRLAWRRRYCADMRTRVLHGPEDYPAVPPLYRLWIRPQDIRQAVTTLRLDPSRVLVAAH